jgi:RNA polymerase sigma-70 factor (ECF subfamily)
MVDIELICQVQNNNKNAFKTLFGNYKKKVYGTAFLILKDYQLAEDVVQETFLQVYLKIYKLSDPLAFEGWLYKITVNLCFEAIKKSKKLKLSSLEEYSELQMRSTLIDYNTPEEAAIVKDLHQQILRCVYSLSPQYAAVLVLYYYDNFNIREISEIVSCSEGSVKVKLFRGRKSLEKLLTKEHKDILDTMAGGIFYENR